MRGRVVQGLGIALRAFNRVEVVAGIGNAADERGGELVSAGHVCILLSEFRMRLYRTFSRMFYIKWRSGVQFDARVCNGLQWWSASKALWNKGICKRLRCCARPI